MSQSPADQPDFVTAGQESVGGAPSAADPHQAYLPVEEPKKKSKTPAIVAGVVALALVVGGALLAMNLLRGGTAVAAKGIPGTAAMVFELNLNPAAADQLALKNIAAKFPQVEVKETTDFKEALWELIPDADDKPDYAEIKPWLGDSAAIGLLAGDDPALPEPVFAIHVTDKAKAEAFVKKEGTGDAQVFFVDDVMVLSPTDSGLTEAAIKGSSVADNADYKADIAKLTGTHLATAWTSPAFADMIISNAEAVAPGTPAESLEVMRGMRSAMALQVSEDLLRMKARAVVPNAPDQPEAADVSDFFPEFDGNSLIAVAGGATEEAMEQNWEQLKQMPEFTQIYDAFAELGITNATDLYALLGSRWGLTFALQSGQPVVGAKLQSDAPARQQELLAGLSQVLGEGIAVEQVDGLGIVAVGQGVDQVTNPATRLRDVESFEKVIDGSAQMALFANLAALQNLPEVAEVLGQDADLLSPFAALGVTATLTGPGESETLIRVAFR
ncbi:MAG: DUF3352 domain-containing protein [Tessaracoccus sp.]|uniref:DUF3352 domain-containing protein n=1 Tax=Tessaracoccus sp. TaxID=1971211 RepID=UPI001EC6F671|nr:DUF3352 domain-containing protein [Tessaracoccus sp.]MBK7821635.1 DUF3352 domain-containing protein [Tessaracoccus sp.]